MGRGFSMHNDIELELPGYVDYNMEFGYHDQESDISLEIKNISNSVSSIDYALIDSKIVTENEAYPELLGEMVKNKSEKLATNVFSINTNGASSVVLKLNREAIPYGKFSIVAIVRDASGNAHGSFVSKFFINNIRPTEEWTYIGTANFRENAITAAAIDITTAEQMVKVFENPDNKGIYYIHEPWKYWSELKDKNITEDKLFINASDPNAVYITNDSNGDRLSYIDGIETGLAIYSDCGKITILMTNDLNIFETGTSHDVPDGTITINERGNTYINLNGLVCTRVFTKENDSKLGNWQSTVFNLEIVDPAVGINEVKTDNNYYPVEYFTLQGMKVSNPSGGIFIRKQGSSVSKIAIS